MNEIDVPSLELCLFRTLAMSGRFLGVAQKVDYMTQRFCLEAGIQHHGSPVREVPVYFSGGPFPTHSAQLCGPHSGYVVVAYISFLLPPRKPNHRSPHIMSLKRIGVRCEGSDV